MANYRVGRVRQEIMREVNDILMRVVKDPRVEGVTITDVELTGDLSEATIYYSTLSDLAGQRQKTQLGLEKATGTVRREISRRIKLYKAPEITFVRDTSIDYGNRIDAILNDIHKQDHPNDTEEDTDRQA